MRHVSTKGLQLIKEFESFSSVIYKDSVGLPTIGYGHLILSHELLSFKNGITSIEAETLLKADLAIAENAVSRLIKVPLTQNQFDGLVSFTFNLGSGALQRSTLRVKVNRQEHESVLADFLRWVYAGGKIVPGLLRRRKAEAKLYSS